MTALKISCSCSRPDIEIESAAERLQFVCRFCGAAILIVQHATEPDETFFKAGREPKTDGPQ